MSYLTPGLRSRSSSVSSNMSDGTIASSQPFPEPGRNHRPPQRPLAASASTSRLGAAGSTAQVRRRRNRSPGPTGEKAVLRGDPVAPFASTPASGHYHPRVDSGVQLKAVPTTRTAYGDGTVYVGEWSNGLQHGFGLCAYPSGHVYSGQWNEGSAEGRGTMLYADGDVFDGHWSRGACDGEGYLFPAEPTAPAVFGTWREGRLVNRLPPPPGANVGEERRTAMVNISRALLAFPPQSPGQNPPGGSSDHGPMAVTPGAGPAPRSFGADPLGGGQLTLGESASVFPALAVSTSHTFQPVQQGDAPPMLNLNNAEVRSDGGGVGPSATSRPHRGPPSDLAGGPSMQHLPPAGLAAALGPSTAAVGGGGLGGTGSGGVARTEADEAQSILFAASGPSYTTQFSVARFSRYFVSMMLPFLSLPSCPCPLRTNILDLEREYVVSGAALRMDFEPPGRKVYLQLWALLLAGVSLVFAILSDSPVNNRSYITIADVIFPFLCCIVFALCIAGYQSHNRVPHALERLDRIRFPKLAKFSSSVVDSRTDLCVATWDEEGENVVYTRKYPRQWFYGGLLFGVVVAAAGPITRAVDGRDAYGGPDNFGIVQAVFSFAAILVGVSCVAYQQLMLIDMQRQVLSRMRIMSTNAYLKGQSVLRPADHREEHFRIDSPLSFADTTRGFIGWYQTRCFLLYASTCSNHSARSTAASIVTLSMLGVYVAAIGDLVYAWSQDRLQNDGYFTNAHMFGLALALTLGTAQLVFLYVLNAAEKERAKHIYLCDVTSAYHYAHFNQREAQVVSHCRNIIRDHDVRFKTCAVIVSGHVLWLIMVLHLLAVAALVTQVAVWAASK